MSFAQTNYKTENSELLARKARRAHRASKALRKKKAAYKRLWRKANPEKVKAQKRREALRQNPRVIEYQREYRDRTKTERAARELNRYHGVVEARECLTPACHTPVSGRTKKCAKCKERDRIAAIAALAPTHGRGKRPDLREAA